MPNELDLSSEATNARKVLISALVWYLWTHKARAQYRWSIIKFEYYKLVNSTRAWAISASLGWAIAVGTHLGYAYVVMR